MFLLFRCSSFFVLLSRIFHIHRTCVHLSPTKRTEGPPPSPARHQQMLVVFLFTSQFLHLTPISTARSRGHSSRHVYCLASTELNLIYLPSDRASPTCGDHFLSITALTRVGLELSLINMLDRPAWRPSSRPSRPSRPTRAVSSLAACCKARVCKAYTSTSM